MRNIWLTYKCALDVVVCAVLFSEEAAVYHIPFSTVLNESRRIVADDIHIYIFYNSHILIFAYGVIGFCLPYNRHASAV